MPVNKILPYAPDVKVEEPIQVNSSEDDPGSPTSSPHNPFGYRRKGNQLVASYVLVFIAPYQQVNCAQASKPVKGCANYYLVRKIVVCTK